jgi:hypothetical protein
MRRGHIITGNTAHSLPSLPPSLVATQVWHVLGVRFLVAAAAGAPPSPAPSAQLDAPRARALASELTRQMRDSTEPFAVLYHCLHTVAMQVHAPFSTRPPAAHVRDPPRESSRPIKPR